MNPSQLPLHHVPPQALQLHQIAPGLQPLDELSPQTNDGFFQQRYAQQLQGANPHTLHFQAHSLQQTGSAPFEGYPGQYVRFDLGTSNSNPPPPPAPQQIQASPHELASRASFAESQPDAEVQHQQQQQPQPHPQPQQQQPQQQQRQQSQEQNQEEEETTIPNHGFDGLKLITDPPNLKAWRDRLFNVDELITLSEEDFQTYFPHIDNIYSHRSTQRHKRKRFASHYWDCRLKGRPAGTQKSTDPEKKKRKRVARMRNLCDVKIKITEYFDSAELTDETGLQPPGEPYGQTTLGGQYYSQNNGATWPSAPSGMGVRSVSSIAGRPRKFYTIQRVNGNGGNGRGDGVAGPHKHTIEESDRVKKNSVQRWVIKNELEKKKAQGGDAGKKKYHKKATGTALATVKRHSKDSDLKLYGSCFCPFVQRVWIALEHKSIPYQYLEVDPYKKPQSLLDVNPRGLVPAIRHGPTWSTHESTVIMEYLEDLAQGAALLPPDPQTRATCRLWADHVNRNLIPCFYRLLQAQKAEDQAAHAAELRAAIDKLVGAADAEGPFFLGPELGFVDVQVAPWVVRLRLVLGPYRGWEAAEAGSRWARWVEAIEGDKSVKATMSTDDLYLESYERYAENRPGTSLLAEAVNSGRELP